MKTSKTTIDHDAAPNVSAADSSNGSTESTSYWRSLEERAVQVESTAVLEDSPELTSFLESQSPEMQAQLADPLARRSFMKLMGASMAFAGVAGAAGCRRWEKEKIVPLSRRPEDYTPGTAKNYASSMVIGGIATPLLVTAYEGRPIKIEGNPDHPSGGGSTTFAQASVLGLYDPDRSGDVLERDSAGAKPTPKDWAAVETLIAGLAGDTRLRVLSEASNSPAVMTLQQELKRRFPQMTWHEWEPLNRDNEREGTRLAFGQASRPVYDLAAADIIVALDADFLVDHPNALAHSRGFAQRRRPDENDMSRVYAIESVHSNTGASADHRLPLRSDLVMPFAMALAAKLDGTAAPDAAFLKDAKVAAFLDALAEDVKGAQGKVVFVAGQRQPAELHALAAHLNAPGSGKSVVYIPDPAGQTPGMVQSITELTTALKADSVDVLVLIGGNPVFDAPADLGFAEALAQAKTSIHLSLYDNETSEQCNWHLPRAHYLEAWGDGLSWDGTYTLAQPIIEPLYAGRSAIELLAMLGKIEDKSYGQALVRAQFDQLSGAPRGGTDKAWRKALHNGFLGRQVLPKAAPRPKPVTPPTLTPSQKGELEAANGELEVVFTTSSHTYDGRFANNAWLQETPDFMTKATWDSVALVGVSTARKLGIDNYTKIKLTADGRTISMPAYVMPGQAPSSIAVSLGHGRTRAGLVGGHVESGTKATGHNAYPLRGSKAQFIATKVTVKTTGDSYPISTTQDHWTTLHARDRATIAERMGDIIREGTLESYSHDMPGWEKKAYPRHLENLKIESLFDSPVSYDGHKWGMATDLGKCTGCNACLLACQSENNIPVVGKREVERSREMNWIRIDRYFGGDLDDPKILHQPVTCQQCENAPCEQVCPVGATLHSDEGLNDMSYNRCVGTRYCLNNCPYRVRRFNFLHWNKDLDEARNKVRQLVFNPEVTVRGRGVMEKCTFCVQRISNVGISARNDKRDIKDGDILTACQQACPTGAIVFGDLNDDNSDVAKLHESGRGYDMLHEFNTRPRNKYLARITNPNPKLAPEPKKSHEG